MKTLLWLIVVLGGLGALVLFYPVTTTKVDTGRTVTPIYVPTFTPTPTICVPRHESFDTWLRCAPTPTPK